MITLTDLERETLTLVAENAEPVFDTAQAKCVRALSKRGWVTIDDVAIDRRLCSLTRSGSLALLVDLSRTVSELRKRVASLEIRRDHS